MRLIAVSQRVDVLAERGERRDGLDQSWPRFLAACGFLAVPIPNQPRAARCLLEALDFAGVLLTGGNDLVEYGGDAPERDATERVLLDEAERLGLPVVGVCRGMQMIQHVYGIALTPIDGHVARDHQVFIDGVPALVNSYHRWGARDTKNGLEVWARADDGVIEAVRDRSRRRLGVMWHPERVADPAARDVALFHWCFGQPCADSFSPPDVAAGLGR